MIFWGQKSTHRISTYSKTKNNRFLKDLSYVIIDRRSMYVNILVCQQPLSLSLSLYSFPMIYYVFLNSFWYSEAMFAKLSLAYLNGHKLDGQIRLLWLVDIRHSWRRTILHSWLHRNEMYSKWACNWIKVYLVRNGLWT